MDDGSEGEDHSGLGGSGELMRSNISDEPYASTSVKDIHSSANNALSTNSRNSRFMPGSSLLLSSARGTKRSRGGNKIPHVSERREKRPSRTKLNSALPSIAKTMARQTGIAALTETHEFILENEDLVAALYAAENTNTNYHEGVRAALPKISEDLCNLWVSGRDEDLTSFPTKNDVVLGVGPNEDTPPLHKAIFISTLLLQVHHPPAARGKQALALTRSGHSTATPKLPVTAENILNPTAMPKVLLDWLDKHHNPWESTFHEVETKHPSPPAHYNFWDVIFVFILRGKIRDAVRILRRSDFRCAETARRDGQSNGYTDSQVENIQSVLNKAIQMLETCPAVKDEDWHVTRSDWAIFRKRVQQTMDDLAVFAEDRDRDSDPRDSAFDGSVSGLRGSTLSHSQIARRAESRVPWTVYQSLKAMYGILLGSTTEIISSAQDWLEASIGLTVWWTGEDAEAVLVGSLAMTKRSLKQSRSRGQRMVDLDSEAAYLDRLSYSFQRATDDADDDEFQINSNNPVEVGLASVFEGNVEGVLSLLHGWSLPVADAIAEIATLGGWFSPSAVALDGMLSGFDESDLMVFDSYGRSDRPIGRDTVMIDYANELFKKGKLQKESDKISREGWEISMALLVRLGDDQLSRREIGKILTQLPIDSDARIDVVLRLCGDYGMENEACAITEVCAVLLEPEKMSYGKQKYADGVAEASDNYGTALIYYARAHSYKKVKDVLDLLISLSLVHSTAFPPLSSLDPNLHSLLFSPKQTLAQLEKVDHEAAAMLHNYLTGYATLRKFYDLRDEDINLEEDQHDPSLPIARKQAAMVGLLSVINSAHDNISGGLYDQSVGAVIQVDCLLALLGEATMFIDQPKQVLTLSQCLSLLKAIEDLQTVTEHIYDKCEECFRSTLAAYDGNTLLASPRQLLKTMSSMTSASSFSLVGSSMLNSQTTDEMGSSHALIRSQQQENRAWDWRKGMAKDARGEDVLRILRLGLARDIARHWVEDEA